MMNRFIALALLSTLTASRASAAHPETWSPGYAVDAQIRVEGRPAPLHAVVGQDSPLFVAADSGRTYSIFVRNRTLHDVAVVVTVDGLNVLDGRRSTFSSDDARYVLEPQGHIDIRGWRTSQTEVRRFVFVDDTLSYARLMGRAGSDRGTIRVLAFARRPDSTWLRGLQCPVDPGYPHLMDRPHRHFGLGTVGSGYLLGMSTPPSVPRAPEPAEPTAIGAHEPPGPPPAAPPRFATAQAGTGWGPSYRDRVALVDFPCAPKPLDHLVFRYEYRQSLMTKGAAALSGAPRQKVVPPPLGFSDPPPASRDAGAR